MGYDRGECFFCYMNGWGNNLCDSDDSDLESCGSDRACCGPCMDAAGERNYRVSSVVENCFGSDRECEFCGKTSYCKMLSVCDNCMKRNQKPRVPSEGDCVVCFLKGSVKKCDCDVYYGPGMCDCTEVANFCSKCMGEYFTGYGLVSDDNSQLEAVAKENVNFDMVEKCDYCDNYSAFCFKHCSGHTVIQYNDGNVVTSSAVAAASD